MGWHEMCPYELWKNVSMRGRAQPVPTRGAGEVSKACRTPLHDRACTYIEVTPLRRSLDTLPCSRERTAAQSLALLVSVTRPPEPPCAYLVLAVLYFGLSCRRRPWRRPACALSVWDRRSLERTGVWAHTRITTSLPSTLNTSTE